MTMKAPNESTRPSEDGEIAEMESADTAMPKEAKAPKKEEKRENMLLNIILNVALPGIILMKFSGEDYLGVKLAIVVALAFPISYGIYDFYRVKKINFFSGLGIVSVLLTGSISLLELDPKYIAIKEAAIPAILGLVTLISVKTPYPLLRIMLFNDKIIQLDKVNAALEQRNNQVAMDKVLVVASCIMAASFFVSSTLNYVLAKWMVVSPAGTEAFNNELGKMTLWSYVVIVIPSMTVLIYALYYLVTRVTKLTGLPLESILQGLEEK